MISSLRRLTPRLARWSLGTSLLAAGTLGIACSSSSASTAVPAGGETSGTSTVLQPGTHLGDLCTCQADAGVPCVDTATCDPGLECRGVGGNDNAVCTRNCGGEGDCGQGFVCATLTVAPTGNAKDFPDKCVRASANGLDCSTVCAKAMAKACPGDQAGACETQCHLATETVACVMTAQMFAACLADHDVTCDGASSTSRVPDCVTEQAAYVACAVAKKS